MNKFKGRLQLAKFKIKKNPTTFALIMFAFFFFVLYIIAFAQKEMIIGAILAIISFTISMIDINILNKINKEWRADLNLIRQKYGLTLK